MPTKIDALLQRLDAMEQRLDELENATNAAATRSGPPAIAAMRPVEARALPPSDDPSLAPTLHITLDLRGISLDGERLGRTEASERIREIARETPKTGVVLLAEPEVPHETMVEVLDLVREAGLERISISARMHGETATAR